MLAGLTAASFTNRWRRGEAADCVARRARLVRDLGVVAALGQPPGLRSQYLRDSRGLPCRLGRHRLQYPHCSPGTARHVRAAAVISEWRAENPVGEATLRAGN
jgi:hypothetical protein